jgi:anti-sigma regulatory factor (Ser/Thr protein kinase)
MNFDRLLDVKQPVATHRSPRQDRLSELIEVTSAEDSIRVTAEVGAILKAKVGLSDPVVNNTMYCLSELLDNVVQHAESLTNGVTCAQAYGTSKAMEMAIVDCGIGVRGSLAKNPQHAPAVPTDAAAVWLAAQRGVTSTPGRNTGEGLFFVAELLARAGRMRLHSGDAMLVINRRARSVRPAAHWPGTIVALRFELKRGVPMRTIFDEHMPLEEPTLFPLDDLGTVGGEAPR